MKKVLSIFVLLLLILNVFAQTVQATSFNFVVSPNTTSAKYGDTITVSLKVADIDAGELGINTVECILQYDEEMFEDIQIQSKNNWSITYNDRKDNENYGKLLAVLLGTGITKDQEIGTISFKIKTNITAKSGNIAFTKVESNDGQNVIPTSDKTVTINIKDENNNSSGNGEDNKDDNVDVNTTIDITDTNNKNDNKNDNKNHTSTNKTNLNSNNSNMSSKPIPQTGDDLFIIVLCIVGMAAISISAYIEYRRYKKK